MVWSRGQLGGQCSSGFWPQDSGFHSNAKCGTASAMCRIVFLNRSSNNQMPPSSFSNTSPSSPDSRRVAGRPETSACPAQRFHTAKTLHPLFLFSLPLISGFLSSSCPTVSVPPPSSNLYFWAYGNLILNSVIVVCGTVPPCWGGYPQERRVWCLPGSWQSLR